MLQYVIVYIVAGFILDHICSEENITESERLYNVLFWPFKLFYKLLIFLHNRIKNNQ